MSRYIDAEWLLNFFEPYPNDYQTPLGLLRACVDDAPSIEPKRGEWIGYNADKGDDWLRSDGEPIFLVCNKCHGTVINNGSAHWNFCPNCGADMREREGE